MRRQDDDNETIRARVAALPASWYAEQPIPPRLARALYEPMRLDWRAVEMPRDLLPPRPPRLSAVEQAHVRASNRLIRRAK